MPEKLVTRHWEEPDSHTLEHYRAHSGYEAARKALFEMEPEAIKQMVVDSKLTGRGGAGFPAGVKWGFVPPDAEVVYLAVNADEGEPGTFGNREIMLQAPHMLLEGMIICARAVGSHEAYVYIRGEYTEPAERFEAALVEARDANLIGSDIMGSGFDLNVVTHMGAGAYICGEETGLIESLEGKRAWPRIKPPFFPAAKGLWMQPTIVHNVETLAYLPHILNLGPESWVALSPTGADGLKLFTLSGMVERPGTYELPMGTPLGEILEAAGGTKDGKPLKCVIPMVSFPPLTADQLDTPMDPNAIKEVGTMLGSGGMIVITEDVPMPWVYSILMRFFSHESCGQCTPCREGTYWLELIGDALHKGEGTEGDLELALDICENVTMKTVCVLVESDVFITRSYIEKFRAEFEERITRRPLPVLEVDTIHGE